jgi:uncharacterized membrane protein YcaP (DUF421 family)
MLAALIPFSRGMEPMPVWSLLIRGVFIYLALLLALRLTGKEQISKLAPYDFMLAILFGSVAAHPLTETNLAMWPTIVSLLTLAVLNIVVSLLTVKSRRAQRILGASPIVVAFGERPGQPSTAVS